MQAPSPRGVQGPGGHSTSHRSRGTLHFLFMRWSRGTLHFLFMRWSRGTLHFLFMRREFFREAMAQVSRVSATNPVE